MPTETRTHGPATRVAIRNLPSLKPEHQTLLRALLADAGMASATLETLVEHLLEEEDPRLGRALARVKAGHASVEVAESAARRPGSTVGSLRPDPAVPGSLPAGALTGTIGNLRRR
jgi:hypothetical protein